MFGFDLRQAQGAEVYYAAPRFTSWDGYVLAYESDQVLERSLLLSPSEIDAKLAAGGEPDGPHRILYDGMTSFVLSEAKELSEVRATDLARKVQTRIEQRSQRMDLALSDVQVALERQREIRVRPPAPEEHADVPYVMRVTGSAELAATPDRIAADRSRRYEEFRHRAASEADARFAVLGFEAWAIGSQLIAVTLPN